MFTCAQRYMCSQRYPKSGKKKKSLKRVGHLSLLNFGDILIGTVLIVQKVRWGFGGGMPTGQQLAWLTWQTRSVHIVYISAAGEELRQGIALSE